MRPAISGRTGRVLSAVARAIAVRKLTGRPARADETVAGEMPAASARFDIPMPLT